MIQLYLLLSIQHTDTLAKCLNYLKEGYLAWHNNSIFSISVLNIRYKKKYCGLLRHPVTQFVQYTDFLLVSIFSILAMDQLVRVQFIIC